MLCITSYRVQSLPRFFYLIDWRTANCQAIISGKCCLPAFSTRYLFLLKNISFFFSSCTLFVVANIFVQEPFFKKIKTFWKLFKLFLNIYIKLLNINMLTTPKSKALPKRLWWFTMMIVLAATLNVVLLNLQFVSIYFARAIYFVIM